MLSSFAFDKLKGFLAELFEDVNARQLDISLFGDLFASSRFELSDLYFKINELWDELLTPVKILRFYIGKIAVHGISEFVAYGTELVVSLENVCIVIAPQDMMSDPERVLRSRILLLELAKRFANPFKNEDLLKILKEVRLKRTGENQTTEPSRLGLGIKNAIIKKVLKAIRVDIKKVHIRWEDPSNYLNQEAKQPKHSGNVSKKCDALGLMIVGVHLRSSDDGSPRSIANKDQADDILKGVSIRGLQVYCDYNVDSYCHVPKTNPTPFHVLFLNKWTQEAHIMLLPPMQFSLDVALNTTPDEKGLTKVKVSKINVFISEILLVLDRAQVTILGQFVTSVVNFIRKLNYAHLLPKVIARPDIPPHIVGGSSILPKFFPQIDNTYVVSVVELLKTAQKTRWAKEMWKYAISCVRYDLLQQNHWKRLCHKTKLLLIYKPLYKRTLENAQDCSEIEVAEHVGLTNKEEWEKLDCEMALGLRDILYYQALSRLESHLVALAAKEKTDQTTLKTDLENLGFQFSQSRAVMENLLKVKFKDKHSYHNKSIEELLTLAVPIETLADDSAKLQLDSRNTRPPIPAKLRSVSVKSQPSAPAYNHQVDRNQRSSYGIQASKQGSDSKKTPARFFPSRTQRRDRKLTSGEVQEFVTSQASEQFTDSDDDEPRGNLDWGGSVVSYTSRASRYDRESLMDFVQKKIDRGFTSSEDSESERASGHGGRSSVQQGWTPTFNGQELLIAKAPASSTLKAMPSINIEIQCVGFDIRQSLQDDENLDQRASLIVGKITHITFQHKLYKRKGLSHFELTIGGLEFGVSFRPDWKESLIQTSAPFINFQVLHNPNLESLKSMHHQFFCSTKNPAVVQVLLSINPFVLEAPYDLKDVLQRLLLPEKIQPTGGTTEQVEQIDSCYMEQFLLQEHAARLAISSLLSLTKLQLSTSFKSPWAKTTLPIVNLNNEMNLEDRINAIVSHERFFSWFPRSFSIEVRIQSVQLNYEISGDELLMRAISKGFFNFFGPDGENIKDSAVKTVIALPQISISVQRSLQPHEIICSVAGIQIKTSCLPVALEMLISAIFAHIRPIFHVTNH